LAEAVGKVPGWVERILIPSLETKVRAIVKEELARFEKVINARFEATDAKIEVVNVRIEALDSRVNSRFDTVDAKIDSLEKRFPAIQEIAEIKARLTAIERERR
jgi:hypothetical protein